MKRHSSLLSLSREHHGALILARLLQKGAPAFKGLPQDLAGKSRYAQEVYRTELADHFLAEEEAVLAQVRGVNSEIDLLVDEIYVEHQQLRKAFGSISASNDLEGDLHVLGAALEAHIRKEERVLFPLIQDKCDETTLTRIQDLLEEKKLS
jgi:iron-sulfur cluster repair protein YtfE (RIC family)